MGDMNVIEWLLDSDPALRWQVLSDLTSAPGDEVSAERARVVAEGWGRTVLDLQESSGTWDGGTYRPGWVNHSKPFFDAWTATHYSLQLLTHLGPEPDSPEVHHAVGLVRQNVRWDVDGPPYFEGETEECINGIALSIGSQFGETVDEIVERLLVDQLGDGGWNCWSQYGAEVSSFHTTICVLEGLTAWERAGGSSSAVTEARISGETYLLERKLFRSRSTNQVVDPRFTLFSFPYYWYYDVLRGLEYFRSTGAAPDERCAEAIDLVAAKGVDGKWPLENVHQGPTHFRMDGAEGDPSRWNTLRARRVLAWANAA